MSTGRKPEHIPLSEIKGYQHDPHGDHLSPATEVVRYADEAMYRAEPIGKDLDSGQVVPSVRVIDMTYDPLRVVAAVAGLYQGKILAPEDIDRDTALATLRGFKRNALPAPLEWVRVSLYIEGVTRAFTHQLVRQRTATYVQESLRFAVKEDAAWETAMPPSIAGLPEDSPARRIWEQTVAKTGWSYKALVDHGIPAEDARGLLPTNIGTRVHYTTDLRNLVAHSGLRLCSQAQYEWKQVWAAIIRAILLYGPDENRWQQQEICTLFAPICYQTGRCEFMGPADRYCRIRDRVEAHRAAGRAPEQWYDIHPHECLTEGAARRM
jgi:flavin-dependent thymidylate synthase